MKQNKPTLSFIRTSLAWYASAQGEMPTEIMIGTYGDDGEVHGEFGIRWRAIYNDLVPRLEIYDDAWGLLPHLQPLFVALAQHDDSNISEPDMAKLLTSLGFKDATEYSERPKSED